MKQEIRRKHSLCVMSLSSFIHCFFFWRVVRLFRFFFGNCFCLIKKAFSVCVAASFQPDAWAHIGDGEIGSGVRSAHGGLQN
jgi:hypothetical protein